MVDINKSLISILSYSSNLQKSDEVGVASVNFKTKELKIIKAGTLNRLIDSLFLEGGEIDGTFVRLVKQ